MNSCEIFNHLLESYGELMQLEGLEATEESFCAVIVDEDITLQMQLDEVTGSLACFINLGRIEEKDRAETYPHLLAANVLWSGTGGATLGVDYEGCVMVCYHEPVTGLDAERLARIIESLVNVAMDWEENLLTLRHHGEHHAVNEREAEETDGPGENDHPMVRI